MSRRPIFSGTFVDTAHQSRALTFISPPYLGAKLYILTRQWRDGADPDTLIIDADSGEVLKAMLPSREAGTPLSTPTSEDDAQSLAQTFARQHFAGFDNLTAVQTNMLAPEQPYLSGSPSPHLASGPLMLRWRLKARSGAWLPTWVSIGVDRQTGQIVLYAASRVDYEGSTTPAVDRDQAIRIALAEAHRSAGNEKATVAAADLAADIGSVPNRLIWYIELNGTVPSSTWGGRLTGLAIDAQTGKINGTYVGLGPSATPAVP